MRWNSEPDMKNKAIGVFDSGLGGLTAVRELIKVLPSEDIIYFGDTARLPYGTRSPEMVTRFAEQDLRFMLTHDLKAILVACGTISSVALPVLSRISPVRITGVVTPASEKAVQSTKNGRILVLGTGTTVNSRSYEKAIAAIDPGISVKAVACPMFVPLVENGFSAPGDKVATLVARKYLDPVKDFGADTVILGCTHFPILSDVIGQCLGDVVLVDSGKAAADDLSVYLKQNGLCRSDGGKSTFYVSDEVSNFASLAEICLHRSLEGKVKKVNIEDY